jgi:hypothetical protein
MKRFVLLLGVVCCTVAASEQQAPPVSPPAKPAEAAVQATGLAGELFGQPVPLANYYFAKRVAYTFPSPWGAADLPEDQREARVWESLILHFEAFRRGITAEESEIEQMVDSLLKNAEQPFTRRSDPAAYAKWVQETLQHDTTLLENQIQFVIQIRKLKDRLLEEQPVSEATEAELQKEFLNEQHHVGGEMVTFDAKAAAVAFYAAHQTGAQWEALKAAGTPPVRPVSLMTVEAYVDLWSIPQATMDAFHALPEGSIYGPLPFGKQWCVYRLLEKRTGDLAEFPAKRDSYVQQVTMKQKYESRNQWIEAFKRSANLKIFVTE